MFNVIEYNCAGTITLNLLPAAEGRGISAPSSVRARSIANRPIDDVISKSRHLSYSGYSNTLRMHKVNSRTLINQTIYYYSDGIDLEVKRFYLYSRVSL